METQVINPILTNTEQPFIVANTLPMSLGELRNDHIIPVFTKDNHPLISQSQLIELTGDVLSNFTEFKVSKPQIRVSHPVMGRIPEARNKKAIDLLPTEKTIYYERLMFLYTMSNIVYNIGGQELTLVMGAIKSYSWDNLNKDHKANQHFKLFIGFQVRVCSNLCVSTDGVVLDFRTNSLNMIAHQIRSLIEHYNSSIQLKWLEKLSNYSLSETQFAQFIGRSRMYQHFPEKVNILELLITDSQISHIVKGYYSDPVFSTENDGISLWNLYNLFTDSNKSSYIDGFLDRGVNGGLIVEEIRRHLEGTNRCWYLE